MHVVAYGPSLNIYPHFAEFLVFKGASAFIIRAIRATPVIITADQLSAMCLNGKVHMFNKPIELGVNDWVYLETIDHHVFFKKDLESVTRTKLVKQLLELGTREPNLIERLHYLDVAGKTAGVDLPSLVSNLESQRKDEQEDLESIYRRKK